MGFGANRAAAGLPVEFVSGVGRVGGWTGVAVWPSSDVSAICFETRYCGQQPNRFKNC
jgi:hypothetical protein